MSDIENDFMHLLKNGITIIKTLWVYVQTAVLVSPNKLFKENVKAQRPAADAAATEMSPSPNHTAISAIKY